MNCYLTELTWLNCHWTVTELFLDWALTLLNCSWTVTWLSCYFTEFFACLNLRNSEVSHLHFLWLVGICIIKNSRRQGFYTDTSLHDMNLIYRYWRYASPTLPVRWQFPHFKIELIRFSIFFAWWSYTAKVSWTGQLCFADCFCVIL